MVPDTNQSTTSAVWRGYLDYPQDPHPSAVVAKFAELDQLRHEHKVYERIKERSLNLDGIPTLIGLYQFLELPGWGVLIQSDCGTSLSRECRIDENRK